MEKGRFEGPFRKIVAVLLISSACALGVSGCTASASGDGGGGAAVAGPAATAASDPEPPAAGSPADSGGEGAGTQDPEGADGVVGGNGDDDADAPDGGGEAGAGGSDDDAEPAAPVAAGRTTTDVVPLGAPPVPVDGEPAGDGLTVELTSIERTEAAASMPGEIAGSAIRVEVAVNNAGNANHELGASVVNLYHGPDRTPASPLSGSGEEDLPGSVAAGQRVTGTYVFSVPESRTGRVLVEIDVDPELHVALFKGEVGR